MTTREPRTCGCKPSSRVHEASGGVNATLSAPPPAKALRAALDEAERLLAEAAPRMVVGDRRASEWYVLLREWQAALAALPTSPPALDWSPLALSDVRHHNR